MGSPVTEPSEPFDAITFRVDSAELASHPKGPASDSAVSRFLRNFPLAAVLKALQHPDESVHSSALQSLRHILQSDVILPHLPFLLPHVEVGLFSPSPDVQSLCCFAVKRVGEASVACSKVARGSGQAPQRGTPPALQAADQIHEALDSLLSRKVLLRGILQCVSSPSLSVAESAADAIVSVCCCEQSGMTRQESGTPANNPPASGSVADEFFSEPILQLFKDILASAAPAIQLRLISLSARLAAVPCSGAPLAYQVGALDALLGMVGGKDYLQRGGGVEGRAADHDELTAVTACEAITDFVCSPGAASLLRNKPEVVAVLLSLAQSGTATNNTTTRPCVGSVSSLLFRAVWKVLARLVSPPSFEVPSPLSEDQANQIAACLADLCSSLAASTGGLSRVLSPTASGQAADMAAPMEVERATETGHVAADDWSREEAILEAVAGMSTSVQGACLLLEARTAGVVCWVAEGAFGKRSRIHPTTDLQVGALHTVASVLGAERGELEGTHARHARGIPDTAASTSDVILCPQSIELPEGYEDRLRESLYYAAVTCPGGPTLNGILAGLLRLTEDVRVAAYRLITALVERPWGLAEVCGSTPLVDLLCDPTAETSKGAMDWRHTCVVAVAGAASAAVTAPGALSGLYAVAVPSEPLNKLVAASRLGPYAVRRAVEATPIVITDERPPTGI